MPSNKPSITLTAAILPMLDCRGAVDLPCTVISIGLFLDYNASLIFLSCRARLRDKEVTNVSEDSTLAEAKLPPEETLSSGAPRRTPQRRTGVSPFVFGIENDEEANETG